MKKNWNHLEAYCTNPFRMWLNSHHPAAYTKKCNHQDRPYTHSRGKKRRFNVEKLMGESMYTQDEKAEIISFIDKLEISTSKEVREIKEKQ